MRVYAATKNAGKLRELRAILRGVDWDVAAYQMYDDPSEGEVSYADNAALKARALASQLRRAGIAAAVVGDDSGIEVAALGGRPGVLSARYGGVGASWPQRRRALLDELAAQGTVDRTARFVCAVHFVGADGAESSSQGAVEGLIAPGERGDGGFSYDPVFWYPPLQRTFAELSEDEKNAISHRARAVQALVELVAAKSNVSR